MYFATQKDDAFTTLTFNVRNMLRQVTQALAEAKKRGWETENGYNRFAVSTPTVEA